jgi:UDP-N-acetylmuramyl pentapeptide phosphotransferase/UDP-N-acetylglucosamine-1-phosphate transferase
LLLGIAGGWAIAAPALPWAFWCAVALLIVVSFLDDYLDQGLSAALRLGAHLIAATLIVATLPPLRDSVSHTLIAVLATCWMCNLYNFMDGSDGLAGGMTFFGFLCYAVAAWFDANTPFALLNLAVAAAAAGFLLHNFHPARIFLGDAGSIPLGFLAAVFGLMGWLQGTWPWWFPLLVFSPFIVDATVTLARRVYARAAVWRAHKDHYYQRLVRLGWGHRRTAFAEYALMLVCGIAALAGLQWPVSGQTALLVAATVAYAAIIVVITLAWRKAQPEQKS